MKELRQYVLSAAQTDEPLLIEGERGTGRERVARLVHELGPRRGQPFVRVDPDLDDEPPALDSDLARAFGGTLLVKEIAHVGHGPQRKLLRALVECEEGKCAVRLIASTGVDLDRAVSDQLFDSELYDKLRAVRLVIPPLRKRPDDVKLLLEHFGVSEARELGLEPLKFSRRALQKLSGYSWPGNVGELRDVVRRLCVRASAHGAVDMGDVEATLPPVVERVPVEQFSFEEMVRNKIQVLLKQLEGAPIDDLYEEVISRVERPLIELVLERTGANQIKAAQMLGLNRNTLRKKILLRKVAVGRRQKVSGVE